MKDEGLISVYTTMNYKIPNVRVGHNWHYICTLLDLFTREIIGYSCGPRKTAELVLEAFANVKVTLSNIKIFIQIEAVSLKIKQLNGYSTILK